MVRLNKFLAERLGISRREADEAISHGKVKINGKTAVLGDRINLVSTGDATWGSPIELDEDGGKVAAGPVEKLIITYNGKPVPLVTDYLYLAMNKPVGYVCSRRAQGNAPTLYDLLPEKYKKLKTVGRLDKDSSGLILLTNDGDFAFQMTHPKFHKEKIYEVELNKPLQPLHQQMISDYGILLDDGLSKFTVIKNEARPSSSSDALLRARRYGAQSLVPLPVGRGWSSEEMVKPLYTVIISEGRNRQIRRTFAALGYRVTKLHRTNFGPYSLKNLEEGVFEEFKI